MSLDRDTRVPKCGVDGLFGVTCSLEAGHDGRHGNGQTTWETRDSIAWRTAYARDEAIRRGINAVQEEFDGRGLGDADLLVEVVIDESGLVVQNAGLRRELHELRAVMLDAAAKLREFGNEEPDAVATELWRAACNVGTPSDSDLERGRRLAREHGW